jgi:ERCC4-type nuclease
MPPSSRFTVKTIPNTPLRPYTFPEGFILVMDTREQAPLFRRPPSGLTITSRCLQNGDYSIQGFEDKFFIERKQTSDFMSYIGKERLKTQDKLSRLSSYDFAALIIEASEWDLLSPQLYSKLTPETVRQSICSFRIRYNLHVYFSRDRSDLERFILDHAIKYYKLKRNIK